MTASSSHSSWRRTVSSPRTIPDDQAGHRPSSTATLSRLDRDGDHRARLAEQQQRRARRRSGRRPGAHHHDERQSGQTVSHTSGRHRGGPPAAGREQLQRQRQAQPDAPRPGEQEHGDRPAAAPAGQSCGRAVPRRPAPSPRWSAAPRRATRNSQPIGLSGRRRAISHPHGANDDTDRHVGHQVRVDRVRPLEARPRPRRRPPTTASTTATANSTYAHRFRPTPTIVRSGSRMNREPVPGRSGHPPVRRGTAPVLAMRPRRHRGPARDRIDTVRRYPCPPRPSTDPRPLTRDPRTPAPSGGSPPR